MRKDCREKSVLPSLGPYSLLPFRHPHHAARKISNQRIMRTFLVSRPIRRACIMAVRYAAAAAVTGVNRNIICAHRAHSDHCS